MKSILISIRPKWVAKILNGEKTLELRKSFPKDYRGWVYIYCTKDNHQLVKPKDYDKYLLFTKGAVSYSHEQTLNGKVVARFWCDNVTEYINGGQWHEDNTFGHYDDYIKDKVCELACVSEGSLFAYANDLAFNAIRISKLEIFDYPKELCEFHTNVKKEPPEELLCPECGKPMEYYEYKYLTKAPQNFCYVEVSL